LIKTATFFLHFLMMTSTLLGLSSTYKTSHTFKNFISSSKMLEYEVTIMKLKKPMIKFILLSTPMTL
jgi:hypothetical protein